MGRDSARVLVIDDDEVVLVAISDLLEEQGYLVYTQNSPIGATQVIVRENIDLAVIDVNLPDMQGDSVVRLFRTWDRLKDLPVVMISGAESKTLEQLQRDLPGVQIIPKSSMHKDLVRTVGTLLGSTRGSRLQKKTEVARSVDVLPAFMEELAEVMVLARQVWAEIGRNVFTRAELLSRALVALDNRARLLNLTGVARLVQAFSEIVRLAKPGLRLPPRAPKSVDDAISALSGLKNSRTGDFVSLPLFLIQDLNDIASELRKAQ